MCHLISVEIPSHQTKLRRDDSLDQPFVYVDMVHFRVAPISSAKTQKNCHLPSLVAPSRNTQSWAAHVDAVTAAVTIAKVRKQQ